MDTEVFRDLLDRYSGLAVTGDAHDVVTELARVRLGHNNILPGPPHGQARSDVTYSCSSPTTAEQIRDAELHAFTFAQLIGFGDWAFGLFYSLFLGTVGALFSVLTAACLFVMANRFLAMATPWIVNVTVYFTMALLQLEGISPNAFFPFNLSQTSLALPFIPLTALACAAAILVTLTFRKARRWDSWQ